MNRVFQVKAGGYRALRVSVWLVIGTLVTLVALLGGAVTGWLPVGSTRMLWLAVPVLLLAGALVAGYLGLTQSCRHLRRTHGVEITRFRYLLATFFGEALIPARTKGAAAGAESK